MTCNHLKEDMILAEKRRNESKILDTDNVVRGLDVMAIAIEEERYQFYKINGILDQYIPHTYPPSIAVNLLKPK